MSPWRAQLSIHLASYARNDVRHGFNIRLSGVKVDNAGAKYIVAADYGVGQKCLTSSLQPIDQAPPSHEQQVHSPLQWQPGWQFAERVPDRP